MPLGRFLRIVGARGLQGAHPAMTPIPRELRRSYDSLLRDMHLALLSEFGARSIYSHLSRQVHDPELQRMLLRLNEDGAQSVIRLRDLMTSMGARPKRTSFRRRALARSLAYLSRVTGPRPILRICQHAEDTVARWYGEYAHFLRRLNDPTRARELEGLRRTKILNAQQLGAFASLLRSS